MTQTIDVKRGSDDILVVTVISASTGMIRQEIEGTPTGMRAQCDSVHVVVVFLGSGYQFLSSN
jgi:hypothetical protein